MIRLLKHRWDQAIGRGISGEGPLRWFGPGTLTLSGANTYAGDTVVHGGKVVLGAGAWNIGIVNGVATINGGVLQLDFRNGTVFPVAPTDTIRVNGGGTLDVVGVPNHNGASYVADIRLDSTNGQPARVTNSDKRSVWGLRFGYQQSGTLASVGAVDNAWDAPIELVRGTGMTCSINAGNTLAISGPIVDYPGLSGLPVMITGTGTVVLSGNNSYAGGTTVVTGTLVAGSDTALGTGPVTINAGATLDVTRMSPGRVPAAITRQPGGTLRIRAQPDHLPSVTAWFDAADPTTLFEDAALTLPATVGGAVGGWKNKGALDTKHARVLDGVPTLGADGAITLNLASFQIPGLGVAGLGLTNGGCMSAVVATTDIGASSAILTDVLGSGSPLPMQMALGNIGGNGVLGVGRYLSGWQQGAWAPLAKDGVTRVLSGRANGDGSSLKVDGAQVASSGGGTFTPINSSGTYRIGRRWDLTTFWSGRYYQIVACSDVAQQDVLDGMLAWRCGLQGQLPATHPYFERPPVAVITDAGITIE